MQTSQSTGFAWSRTSLSFVIGYHFLLLETSLSYHAMGKNSTRPKRFPSFGREQVRSLRGWRNKKSRSFDRLFPDRLFPHKPQALAFLRRRVPSREKPGAPSAGAYRNRSCGAFLATSPRAERECAARSAKPPPPGGWRSKKSRSLDRDFFGAPSGTRTQDPLIKSQLLYQLS